MGGGLGYLCWNECAGGTEILKEKMIHRFRIVGEYYTQ